MRTIPGTENISRHKEGFQLEKTINGKKKYFGYARTLIEAFCMRDILDETNWERSISKLNSHRYIHKTKNGTYMITRKIKGKTRYYGHFLNLKDAINHRDLLDKKGWSSNYKYCRNPNAGIHLNKHGSYEVFHYCNGKNEYFGCYKTLEEAKAVKELCIKYNGDWELMVDCVDFDEYSFMDGIKLQGTFEKNNARNDYFIAKNSGIL
ncbi:hypothetical protein [Methanobrevibacter sp.]|uniref:hypothetical protein n=1 Tax=Methanobrevibacter sp. TaxID=66852 RepID=UPI0025E016C2|nr:hypothetical protein [Methanobrevibacter sp.]MBQ2832365.1 hypothetical protein [Methanobrevibacter sp.]